MLRESEQRFREIFENSRDNIFLLEVTDDMRFRNLDFNPAFEKNTGRKRSDLIGKFQEEVIPSEVAQKRNKQFLHCIETKKAILNKETELKLSEGTRIFLASIIPIADSKGYITDITSRKNAENKLIKNEQRYREMFDNSHDSIYLLEVLEGPHFRLLDVNPQYEKEVGIDREKQIGHTMEENTTPEVAAIVNAKYQRCLDAGTTIKETVELAMPQGLRTYHSSLVPIRNDSGKIYRIMGISRDVTEEIKAKKALETSQKRLSKAELVASIGHIEYDFLNDMNYWSNGAYEILNIPEGLRRPGHEGFRDLIHPDDKERVNNALDRAAKELTKFNEVYKIIDYEGNEKVIHGTGQVLVDKNIARFFNVKTTSIQTSRVRLKKKLKLTGEHDLRDFILSL
jgi:PAS domain S-box-containing protein